MNTHYYTVDQELAFIAGIGTYATYPDPRTKAQLLRGYLVGLGKRTAGLSQREIALCRQRATVLLNAETQGGSNE